ncbi:MAG: hypothetical protein GY930_09260 [bacterium]|nr:hypothetical protein [bacterium]
MDRFSPKSPHNQPGPGRSGETPPCRQGSDFAIPPVLAKQLAVTGREFLTDLLGAEVERRPSNQPALTTLSQCLAKLDRRLEGLQVDEKLAQLNPLSPIVQYNLACSQALNQDAPAALKSIGKAIDLGFTDANFMASDPDLESLHPLNSFRQLVQKLSHNHPTRPE